MRNVAAIYLTVLFCLMAIITNAQHQGDTWYFYDSAGISFLSGKPVVLTDGALYDNTGYPPNEGSAIISDSDGNVLFYANPHQIWNRDNNLMPNGKALLGGTSSSQGAFVAPMPDNDSLYYFFTLDDVQDSLRKGLNYSIVNMCLACGLGDVIPGKKNIHLMDSAGEKMAGTYHANGKDIWIVIHQFYNDAFYAYLLTKNGIEKTVVSHVGAKHAGYGASLMFAAWGQMKISPDGRKIASAMCFNDSLSYRGKQELFDFDNSSGIVSNAISLSNEYCFNYGVSFSADNSKLYFNSLDCLSGYYLLQYNLNDSNILSTKSVISKLKVAVGMQLGPDKKIYEITGDTDKYLGVINAPDSSGLKCNYNRKAVFHGVTNGTFTLPSFFDNFVYHNKGRRCGTKMPDFNLGNDTVLCGEKEIHLNPHVSAQSYLWQDNSTDSTFTVRNPGRYAVTVTYPTGCVHTIGITINRRPGFNFTIPSDTSICPGTSFTASLPFVNGAKYTWQDGSSNDNIFVQKSGKYWVTASNNKGCTMADTMKVSIADTVINFSRLPHDTVICAGQVFFVNLNWLNCTLKWQDNSTDDIYRIADSGSYSIEFYTLCKKFTHKFKVSFASKPYLGKDTILCDGASYIIKLSVDGSKYTWQNGSNNNSFSIDTAGIYTVQSENQGCVHSDTLKVKTASKPGKIFLRDTALCPGEEVTLHINGAEGSIMWQNGSTDTNFVIANPGIYSVTISNICGVYKDSVIVKRDSIRLNLGKDIHTCETDTVVFNLKGMGDKYLWSDSSTLSELHAKHDGTYWVFVKKRTCSASDTISIKYDHYYGNTRFLPHDTNLCIGQSINFDLDKIKEPIYWNTGAQSKLYNVNKEGIYIASFSNTCGIYSDTSLVQIKDCSCQIVFPNIFSPNNDFTNETFHSVSDCEFISYYMAIYNRWGELIYTSSNANAAWDGKYNGLPCPEGVYLWTLKAESIHQQKFYKSGTITLVK